MRTKDEITTKLEKIANCDKPMKILISRDRVDEKFNCENCENKK